MTPAERDRAVAAIRILRTALAKIASFNSTKLTEEELKIANIDGNWCDGPCPNVANNALTATAEFDSVKEDIEK